MRKGRKPLIKEPAPNGLAWPGRAVGLFLSRRYSLLVCRAG
jgi:hypothetical protein